MKTEQAIQKVMSQTGEYADEAERMLRNTMAVLSKWEPSEITAQQLADRVLSNYPPHLVDDQFRDVCLSAARVTLEATCQVAAG